LKVARYRYNDSEVNLKERSHLESHLKQSIALFITATANPAISGVQRFMSIAQTGYPKRLVTLTTTAGVMGLTTLLTMASAQAATVNGGFETGDLTGWNAIGNTSIQTSGYGSGPAEGSFNALLSAPADNSDALPSELETFLDLSLGSLDGINGPIYHGSAIKQAFSAEAGQVLTFQWNFLTNESQDSTFSDFAFVSIQSLTKLGDTSSSLFASQSPLANETGFQTFSYTIPTTGTYTLGIGVANATDSFGNSAVLVDNVAVVPTPSLGMGLLTAGFLSLRSKFSRNQKKA